MQEERRRHGAVATDHVAFLQFHTDSPDRRCLVLAEVSIEVDLANCAFDFLEWKSPVQVLPRPELPGSVGDGLAFERVFVLVVAPLVGTVPRQPEVLIEA